MTSAGNTVFDSLGNLYVAGNFAGAGGKVSPYLAKCMVQEYPVVFHAASGGSIAGAAAQTVTHLCDATPVTAVPDGGWEFVGWNGDYVGFDNPLTITSVTAAMAITANFAAEEDAATLTVTHVGEGQVAPTGSIRVARGVPTVIFATPDAGVQFIRWDVSAMGNVADIRAAQTTVTLSGDAVVTAVFAADGNTALLTVQSGANGAVELMALS